MTKSFIIKIISSVFLISCGGTHGKIETFPFYAPKDTIEKIINEISGNDSIYFIKNDATTYKDIYLSKGNDFQVFTYHFYGDSGTFWNDNKSECAISLVYVKKMNQFRSENNLSNEEKEKAVMDFNKNFITIIKSKVKKR